MSRIFEAFNTPRKNGFNEISLQKSFQERISDRTRTDRCSARTCSRTSSRCARSGRCGFATSGGNWNKHNRRGAAPTIGQCRDPGGWHRPPPASRAGTDGDPALSIVSVERGRASEGGNEGRQSEIDAHNGSLWERLWMPGVPCQATHHACHTGTHPSLAQTHPGSHTTYKHDGATLHHEISKDRRT